MNKVKLKLTSPLLLFMLTAFFLTGTVFSANPEKAKESFNTGIKEEQAGNIDGAIIAYRGAIDLDPNFTDAYLNLGTALFSQKKYDEALSNFKTATEKDPKNVSAFSNLGKVQYILQRYAEAETSFKSAIALSPSEELYKELGKVYYKKKNYKEVIDAFNKCHELGGGDYLTYYMLGKSYQKEDQIPQAISALNKSINQKGDNYNAHSTLGQIYLTQEKYSNAASSFRSAMKANPGNYRAVYNFAVAQESANPDNYSDNMKYWEDFIKVAKNNPKAKRDVEIARKHVDELKEAAQNANLQ